MPIYLVLVRIIVYEYSGSLVYGIDEVRLALHRRRRDADGSKPERKKTTRRQLIKTIIDVGRLSLYEGKKWRNVSHDVSRHITKSYIALYGV